jgi:hypothetical protein
MAMTIYPGAPTDHPCIHRPLVLKRDGTTVWRSTDAYLSLGEFVALHETNFDLLARVWGTLDELFDELEEIGWFVEPSFICIHRETGMPLVSALPGVEHEETKLMDREPFEFYLPEEDADKDGRFQYIRRRYLNGNEELSFELRLPSFVSRGGALPAAVTSEGIWSRWPYIYVQAVAEGIKGVLPFEEIRFIENQNGYLVTYARETTVRRTPLQIALALLETLRAIHARGWIHGSIKHEHIRSFTSGVYLCGFETCRKGKHTELDRRDLGLTLLGWYMRRTQTDLHSAYRRKQWIDAIPKEAHALLNHLFSL